MAGTCPALSITNSAVSLAHDDSAEMLRSAKDLKHRHLTAALNKLKAKLGDDAANDLKAQHLEKMLKRFER